MEVLRDADIASARRLFCLEAAGIKALEESIDDNFSAAVRVLHNVTGRVIVSGMGKSGHVGRKIAATLASTGTPAHYVHPGEASHGDLGMVTRDDAVLALSNSGETPELRDIAEFTRRFSIPLIVITSGVGSTLSELADVVLLLPAIPEACPMGLAPTTSTTMSLAMGDAIAVTLLERKGFSAKDFKVLHPGGKLGNSLLRVSDLMHEGDELPLATGDVSMLDVIPVMSEKRFGCVGVVNDDGDLVGIVTDGDLRRTLAENLLNKSVADVMTTAPKTIKRQALAAEAVAVMNDLEITNLFVVDEKSSVPMGIVHIHDLLKAGIS
ncbi:MAG: KpsF/GutQ family sugar-phosphate isomerase [Pseudomonadota bacterium]|nr:KpsF/GutQ family sugar-phosphate isomerase [Pseudomonadota bacterium]